MLKKIFIKIKELNPFKKKINHYPTNRIHEMDVLLCAKFQLDFYQDELSFLFDFNNNLDFWSNVVTAMCFAESDYNANHLYMEPAPLKYYSCGLMQLSHVDMKNHPDIKVDITGDLIFVPANNIAFGLFILNKQMKKYGAITMNKSFYWSVLNTSKSGYKKYKFKFDELQGWNK